ncbi:hypothetical protein [Natronobacterium texcoconense]|uniref:Uncharacterized protein n=1 Tax=Natronobacterium texcoconense TaxID=1095778 RepID=A0A1H1HSH7_NATTX|nr:hypothetical protein [Natronobacterium texcoconense]SDR28078.1 hypothetical protein SAMN04489842_2988 [Natronobacterium texcoconense]
MNSNSRHLPPDILPPGWSESALSDGELAYRHARLPLELVADRTMADNCHPGLGLGCCWELRYRYPIGDQSVSETIGRVSTRTAAIDGLLECMRSVHEAVESLDDPMDVRNVLERIPLSSLVPDGSPGCGGI